MRKVLNVVAAAAACLVGPCSMAQSTVKDSKSTVTVESTSVKADGFAVSLSIQPIRLGISRSGEISIGEIYACNDAQISGSSTTVNLKNSSFKSGGRVGIGTISAGC